MGESQSRQSRQAKRDKAKKRAGGGRRRPAAGGELFSSEAPVRLQRLLAAAGYGSRRHCESLIEESRVSVNGDVVTKLGTTVRPSVDKVSVDGTLLRAQRLVYFAVNKPVGVVTTNRDPQGRPRVVDLVPPTERVFPVGRLDRSSEGLILVTNDGELAQKLSHPKFGIRKVYRVTVAGKVDPEAMKQMRRGIHLTEGLVKVEGVKLVKARSRATELEIVLAEGKNREIRRILARLGHKVMTLRRIAVGPLKLGDVPPGAHRVLTRDEVDRLYRIIEQTEGAEDGLPPPKKPKRRTGAKKRPGGRDAAVGRRTTKKASKASGGRRPKPAPGKRGGVKRRPPPTSTVKITAAPGQAESGGDGRVIGDNS